MSALANLIQQSFGGRIREEKKSQLEKKKKKRERESDRKKVELSLLAEDMTLYIGNLTDATRKLLYLINELGKIAGHKINSHLLLSYALMMK